MTRSISNVHWDTRTSTGSERVSGFSKIGSTSDFVKPTKYMGFGGRQTRIGRNPYSGSIVTVGDIPNVPPLYAAQNDSGFGSLNNRAWSKLVDKVRDGPAAMGESVVQSGQAFDMIAARCTSMYRAYRELRRGKFRRFLRALRIGPLRKHRNKILNSVNEASGLWLEYSFGWKPLASDIYDACTVLTRDVPGGKVKVSVREPYVYRYPATGETYTSWTGFKYCTAGGVFGITNPNLYLLQQLGLANPTQILWNLLPWSFVVDWVFDIGSFIGGYSDFLGVSILNPYTSHTTKASGLYRLAYPGKPVVTATGEVWALKRVANLIKPVPNFDIFNNIGSSLTRAANAASLLGQIISK